MTDHTPLPWHKGHTISPPAICVVDDYGEIVFQTVGGHDEERADLIIRAVNAHDGLIATMESAALVIEGVADAEPAYGVLHVAQWLRAAVKEAQK